MLHVGPGARERVRRLGILFVQVTIADTSKQCLPTRASGKVKTKQRWYRCHCTQIAGGGATVHLATSRSGYIYTSREAATSQTGPETPA